jgi:hypothetical protein
VSGYPITVGINEFTEFDLADAWLEERYELICITNRRWRKWTHKRIDMVLEKVANDLQFCDLVIEIECRKAGQPASQEVCFKAKEL